VVTVVVDRAAQAEIGGLAAQLRTADVAAAGWSVAGPRALPGGGSEVAATHPFTDGAQLSALLAEVIAPTRIHGRAVVPLTLTVSTHRSFWRTTRRVSGAVDLRCGLGCFGDAALRRAFGSVVGVDPAPLGGRAAATRALPFTLRVAIGGRVTSAPGATGAPGRLTWSASLGQRIPIDATVVTEDTAHVRDARIAAAVGGAVVVALVAVGVVVAVRRRRSRHRLRHAAGP
jgi:hypothetical protein